MKRIKVLYKITISLFLVVVISLSVVIYGNTIEEQPSELALKFKEVWLPYILILGSSLGGTALGNTIINAIFRKSLALLGISDNGLKEAIKVIKNSDILHNEERQAWLEKFNTIEEANNSLVNKVKTLQSGYENFVREQKERTDKIIKVLEIAFLNDSDLVRKGYASEISKVINDEETKKETII